MKRLKSETISKQKKHQIFNFMAISRHNGFLSGNVLLPIYRFLRGLGIEQDKGAEEPPPLLRADRTDKDLYLAPGIPSLTPRAVRNPRHPHLVQSRKNR